MKPQSRIRSAAAHSFTTTGSVPSDFVQAPTPSGSEIDLRRAYYASSRNLHDGPARLQRSKTGRLLPGSHRLSRTYPFFVLLLPVEQHFVALCAY